LVLLLLLVLIIYLFLLFHFLLLFAFFVFSFFFSSFSSLKAWGVGLMATPSAIEVGATEAPLSVQWQGATAPCRVVSHRSAHAVISVAWVGTAHPVVVWPGDAA